jgi:HD-like signal output (HDOD) protein
VIRNAVLDVLQRGQITIPAFAGSATKLRVLLKDPNADLARISEVIKLDPGLAAQYLKSIQSNPQSNKKTTTNLLEALRAAGVAGVRQQASTVGVVNHVQHMRTKVNWDLFWLHSVFVARLCELIAKAFRPLTGMEYLAGLFHDAGKAFLEHYFPQDFESVLFHVMERQCTMLEAEQKLLGISHPEISSLLCEKWGLHREIARAVRFHHEPESPFNKDNLNPENAKFLATCVCVADSLANYAKVNILLTKDYSQTPIQELPGWAFLQTFEAKELLEFDLTQELHKTHNAIEATRTTSE